MIDDLQSINSTGGIMLDGSVIQAEGAESSAFHTAFGVHCDNSR